MIKTTHIHWDLIYSRMSTLISDKLTELYCFHASLGKVIGKSLYLPGKQTL